MKARILIIIVGFVLISCSNRTDSKTINSTEKRETVQTDKSKKTKEIYENEYYELEKKLNGLKMG